MFLFTIWLTFAEPGVLHGELRLCVQSSDATSATAHAVVTARRLLPDHVQVHPLTAAADGCPWMPDDTDD